jgi:hypothetical protein
MCKRRKQVVLTETERKQKARIDSSEQEGVDRCYFCYHVIATEEGEQTRARGRNGCGLLYRRGRVFILEYKE